MGLKVLFVSAEVAPFAKVGGLADVAGSLPKALARLGHDVRVMMPGYAMAAEGAQRVLEPFRFFLRPNKTANAWMAERDLEPGVPLLLLGGHPAFEEVTRSELVYRPGRDAYLWLAKAALKSCEKAGWIPDVVHAHDWHTGFVPVVVREQGGKTWENVATCFTIHNLAYQGEFGFDTLDQLGLDHRLYNMHQLETFGKVNFLKAGCVFADQVNTVSPTYALQVQTPEYGCRLEGLMAWLQAQGRFRGILNGIDLEEFDPARDPHIPVPFSVADPTGKAACRRAFAMELGWKELPKAPIAGVVSRLSSQKGFDLILEAMPRLLESTSLRLAVLGTGDPWAATGLRALEAAHPDRVRFLERFDLALAQRVYAGSDLFLMPSAFEPCGLGQLIAMRYGSVPVVRRTGGLADTVFEGENGFVFEERTAQEYAEAVERACAAFGDASRWRSLVRAGMERDSGWDASAPRYAALFEDALMARRPPLRLVAGG